MNLHRRFLTGAVVFLSLGFAGPAWATVCDVDTDGDVDRLDIDLIVGSRNSPASGSNDPRDADGDGFVTLLDVRTCALHCTLPRCAIVDPVGLAPTVDAGPDVTIDAGATFDGSGSFTDPDAESWQATVDYGDGTGVQPLALNADKTFGLTHVYPVAGAYTLTVSVFDSSGGSGSDEVVVTVNPAASGLLLEGDPDLPALDALLDFDAGDRSTADEISVAADGTRIDRTNIEISFLPGATVAEVNALLESIGGRIVNMLPGVNVVVVRIPDPGDLFSLYELIERLAAEPIVEAVLEARMKEPDELPANYEPGVSDIGHIDHHLAVLAPAAWNARAAIDYHPFGNPLLLQADSFGDGAPNADFDVAAEPADFGTGATRTFSDGTVGPYQHGAHVLGIITGLHNTDPAEFSQRDQVWGMYPGTLDLRVADLVRQNAPHEQFTMARIIRGSVRRVVVNTSLHSGCARPPTAACVIPLTYSWLKKIRGAFDYYRGARSEFEKFYVHLTSAGNFRSPPAIDSRTASLNSEYAAARLFPGLNIATDPPTPVPNLTNTLVVENRKNGSAAPFAPGCLSSSSKFPGEISAIGEQVWSFTGVRSGADDKTGTSMSTPQVAGLAAYLWALRPMLTPEELIAILTNTARRLPGDAGCATTPPTNTVPAPVIDAYAAVLAVDDPNLLNPLSGRPMDAPARLAIFDVADELGNAGANRIFDEHDLNLFVNTFVSSGNDGFRDYSRYDLNGDGFTGNADGRERFNLDLDADQIYGSVVHEISGSMVTYDENAVTDWETLCYYAYSPLFTGNTDLRDSLLEPYLGSFCGGRRMQLVYDSTAGSTDNEEDIFIVDGNGANQRQLTDTTDGPSGVRIDHLNPKWSPDGQKIVFEWNGVSADDDGELQDNTELFVMNADGSEPVNITQLGDTDEAFAAWSPDSSRIAFVSDSEALYVVNRDGSGRVKLYDRDRPDEVGRIEPEEITWTPDGQKIYFQSDGDDFLYSINIDSTGLVALSTMRVRPSPGGSIRWSPDASTISFPQRSCMVDPSGNLSCVRIMYTMDVNSGVATPRHQNDDTRLTHANWSRDGSKLVFFDTYALKLLTLGGGTESYDLPGNSLYHDPQLSPDGKAVVFQRRSESIRDPGDTRISDLYVIDLETAEVTNLSNTPDDNEWNAKWR